MGNFCSKRSILWPVYPRQYTMGDTFTGFEFDVPLAPDGLRWIPHFPQGTYVLVGDDEVKN